MVWLAEAILRIDLYRIFLALSLVTLAACGKNEAAKLTSSTNNHQSKVQGQVTLILKTEKESKKKSVEIQPGIYVYFDKTGIAYPPRVLN